MIHIIHALPILQNGSRIFLAYSKIFYGFVLTDGKTLQIKSNTLLQHSTL